MDTVPLYNVQSAHVQSFHGTFITGGDEIPNRELKIKLTLESKHKWIELWEAGEAKTIHEIEHPSVDLGLNIKSPLLQDENMFQQCIELPLASVDYFTPKNLNYLKAEIARRANRLISGTNRIILGYFEGTVQVVTGHYYQQGAATRIMHYIRGFSFVPGTQKPGEVPKEVEIHRTVNQVSHAKQDNWAANKF